MTGGERKIKRRRKYEARLKEKRKAVFKKWLIHIPIFLAWTAIVVLFSLHIYPFYTTEKKLSLDAGVVSKTEVVGSVASTATRIYEMENGNRYYIETNADDWFLKKEECEAIEKCIKQKETVYIKYDEDLYSPHKSKSAYRIVEMYTDEQEFIATRDTNFVSLMALIILLTFHLFVASCYLYYMWYLTFKKTPPLDIQPRLLFGLINTRKSKTDSTKYDKPPK